MILMAFTTNHPEWEFVFHAVEDENAMLRNHGHNRIPQPTPDTLQEQIQLRRHKITTRAKKQVDSSFPADPK